MPVPFRALQPVPYARYCQDVEDFLQHHLNQQPQIGIYNECDFQVQLAIWLWASKNGYNNVYTEYRVTYDEINSNYALKKNQWPWPTKRTTAIHVDIVVEKEIGGQKLYVPIELKFKTKEVSTTSLAFDEPNPDKHSRVLYANQVAYRDNISKVWKDVHRIELLHKAFTKVVGGVVVFLTNDDNYWKSTTNKVTTYPNRVNSIAAGTRVTDGKATFVMQEGYSTRWISSTTPNVGHGFRAGIIVIP